MTGAKGSSKGKGKGSQPKKPEGVKGKKTSYLFWAEENRERVTAENPDEPKTNIPKIMGAEWKALSEEEKKPYKEMQAQDKERFDEEVANLATSKSNKGKKRAKESEDEEEDDQAASPPPTKKKASSSSAKSTSSSSKAKSSSQANVSDDEEEEEEGSDDDATPPPKNTKKASTGNKGKGKAAISTNDEED